jgi:hypothetical protein
MAGPKELEEETKDHQQAKLKKAIPICPFGEHNDHKTMGVGSGEWGVGSGELSICYEA